MKFSEGDQVLAKLPTSQEYEKAKIVNVKGSKYKVQFRGGVEHTLAEGDIRVQRTSRSQSRSRGRPTGKSPSRSSPSRKSPARKSPARSPNAQVRKLSVRSARQAKISLARLEIPKENSSDTDRTEGFESLKDEFEPPTQSHLRELGPITRRSIRIATNASKAEQEQKLMMLRGVDRAASLPVERKSPYEGKERGLSVQHDEDPSKMSYDDDAGGAKGKNREIDLGKSQEWGGWFGAFILMLVLPVCTVLLQIACYQDHCSSKHFRLPRYKEWKTFLNADAFIVYAGFLFFVSIISALPIGRLVDGQQSKVGRLQYRINGLLIVIVALAAFLGSVYKGFNVADFVLKKSLQFSVAGLTCGILLSLALYIKGGRVPVSNLNMYGSTSSRLYNFWQGREINPRVGPLDLKLVLFRTASIGVIIINAAALTKILKGNETLDLANINLAAVIVASLQMAYFLDILIFESSIVTTFEFTYEGTGYMLSLGYLIYPHLATLTTRYLLIHKVQQSTYALILPVIIFFIGYVIYKKSNWQKNEFRKNPFAPSVCYLETIPTKRGKRLIVSGLWGYVRHPNYLGDILMHWSMACLSCSTDILPYVFAIQLTLVLMHRARRDNAWCEKRYGYAWEQYCSRVKYMIFSRVY